MTGRCPNEGQHSRDSRVGRVGLLLLQAVATLENVKTHPVIDLHFLSSEPQPASTKPINLGWEMSTVNFPTAQGSGAGSSQLELGRSFLKSLAFGLQCLIPQDLVI